MENCAVYTLTEIVERYCVMQFNNRQKGFKNYLVMAEQVWNDLFNNTLWCFKSVWLTPQQGSPYPFINLPENYSRMLSLRSECVGKDGVSFLQPVLANDTTTAMAKPAVKACGCKKNCGCGALCDGVASMSYETYTVTIAGTDYEGRTWIEVQPNGDVWRWREVPTPFYDSTGEFDGTQFDPTQFDTNIGEAITNVQIVKLQERIGKVELKACGCVAETPENKTVLGSCFCTGCASTQKGARTTYKFSDCGTKLYLIGAVKSNYLLQYQLSGASAEADVPRYAAKAVWDGITFFSRAYNNSVSRSEVKALETTYRASKNTILEYLNPIDLDVVNQLRDEPIKL